jgi:hypothetical protein
MYPMVLKYTYQHFSFQGPPKFTQIGTFLFASGNPGWDAEKNPHWKSLHESTDILWRDPKSNVFFHSKKKKSKEIISKQKKREWEGGIRP